MYVPRRMIAFPAEKNIPAAANLRHYKTLPHTVTLVNQDVREPHEYQICSIPGTRLIPLGEVPQRVHELDSADEIIAHCKSGMRSGKADPRLQKYGPAAGQNPNCSGWRPMIMAAITFGTYSRVSAGSARIRYRYQKLRCRIGSLTFRTACLTFPGPRL